MATTGTNSALDQVRARDWAMLVGGEMVAAQSGDSYETDSPAFEEPLASVPAADAADIDRAVRLAGEGAKVWAETPVQERAATVRRMAEVLVEHEQEIGLLDALDGGNPVTAMRGDVHLAAELMRTYADWALELKGETLPLTPDHLHYTVREPYGVVARIVPYNHPAMFTAARSAPPLVAGNAVVVKAPDQTPLSALRMGELFRDLLPPGVLTIVSGHGAVAGDALVRHPDIRRIGFIGSVPTGQRIQRAAAESGIKTVTLELGGKNPMIVFPDADFDRAVEGAVRGMNFHWTGGQSCGSTSRLLLHESLADEFVPALVERVGRIRIGSPLDPATEMGALVSRAQYDKVMHYIEAGVAEGASLVAGGGRPPGPEFDRGYFVEPTIFTDVLPSMRIAQEEIFGPVLSVLTWREPEEALRIANGVSYGLTASIWTRDVATAHRTARKVEAGFVWVNNTSTHFAGAPFGGFKDSGVGREEGVQELLDFTQLKTVSVALDG
jgi:acyl-CoA reductase-like NAD-dependent aldehyde dehydrogenase